MSLKQVFKGLTAVFALLLALVIAASTLMFENKGIINTALNAKTTEIITSDEDSDVDTEYYTNEYGATDLYNYATTLEIEKDVEAENLRQAEEGTVLLRNEDSALPIASSDKVTVFGNGSTNSRYNKSTTTTSMDELDFVTFNMAMENVFGDNVNLTLSDKVYGSMSTTTNDTVYEADIDSVKSYESTWTSDYNDAAIVVFTRWGSEDAETSETEANEGTHYLNLCENEKDLLTYLNTSGLFDKIIVILNSDQMMELDWLDDYGIDACLLAGIPGQKGFQGVVNVMVGDVTPSGHTVDTYVNDYTSSPAMTYSVDSTQTWSNLDDVVTAFENADAPESETHYSYWTIYSEGIYVGYKYYETRYEDAVMSSGNATASAGSTAGSSWSYSDEVAFTFGYGLSYTTFKQTLDDVSYDSATDTYSLEVTVENTGSVSGMSVVEVYAQTPYGDYEKENLVEKSAVSVVGFEKTDELDPGETETVTVEVEKYLLASYDAYGEEGYILSEGDYYFAIGDNAHDALNNILAAKGYSSSNGMVDTDGNETDGDEDKTYSWTQANLDTDSYNLSRYTGDEDDDVEVTNQFDDDQLAYYGVDFTYLSRSDWDATYPDSDFTLAATDEMIEDLQLDWYETPEDAPAVDDFTQGADVTMNFVTLKDVDWHDDDIWEAFIDQMTVEEMLVLKADGNGNDGVTRISLPSQSRGDDGVCIQQGSLLATDVHAYVWVSEIITSRTWNKERFSERGRMLGIEAVYCGLNELWYGGGNIHRTAFGGRNMQYYSEDGNFGYYVGWYEAEAMQKVGIIYGIKHFALNDQELHRESLATFSNEQAIREVYLRSFEGAMCKGEALGIMTGFNRIGVDYVATNTHLVTDVLKGEWNSRAHVTTDAGSTSYKSHALEQLAAGIDYTCWNTETDTIQEAIETDGDGYILECLRLATKYNLYAASRSMTVNGLTSNSVVVSITPAWQTALAVSGIVLMSLTGLCLVAYVLTEILLKDQPAKKGGKK